MECPQPRTCEKLRMNEWEMEEANIAVLRMAETYWKGSRDFRIFVDDTMHISNGIKFQNGVEVLVPKMLLNAVIECHPVWDRIISGQEKSTSFRCTLQPHWHLNRNVMDFIINCYRSNGPYHIKTWSLYKVISMLKWVMRTVCMHADLDERTENIV